VLRLYLNCLSCSFLERNQWRVSLLLPTPRPCQCVRTGVVAGTNAIVCSGSSAMRHNAVSVLSVWLVWSGRVWSVGCVVTGAVLSVWLVWSGRVWSSLVCWLCGYPELFCLWLVWSGRVWSVGCVVTGAVCLCGWLGLVESGLLAMWLPGALLFVIGLVWSSLVCWLCGYPELFCLRDWFGLVESGLLAVWLPVAVLSVWLVWSSRVWSSLICWPCCHSELFCLWLVWSGRVWSIGCAVTRSCFVCVIGLV